MSRAPEPAPPHNVDVEAAVLGAVLLNNEVYGPVAAVIDREDISRPRHRILWDSLTTMIPSGDVADLVTVTARLAAEGNLSKAGGAAYIQRLTDRCATVEHAEHYARIVRELSGRRREQAALQVAAQNLRDPSSDRSVVLATLRAELARCAPTLPDEKPPQFTLQTGADLVARPPTVWRIKGLCPNQGVGQIFGASGSGKTFLALHLAFAVAEGHLWWFGCRVRQAPVVYVCLEGVDGLRNRVAAWAKYRGRPLPDDLRVITDPFRLNQPHDVEALATASVEAFPRCSPVIIIDTQAQAAPDCDENSSADMGKVIVGAQALQRRTGGLVILIHHVGKDSTKGARGHSSQFASLDFAIEVIRNQGERRWRVAKSKDGEDGAGHPFDLEVVEVGEDEDGEPITSCVVVELDHASPIVKPRTPSQEMCFQSLLEAARTSGELDAAGNFVGVHLEAWRDVFYSTSTADSQDAKKKAFRRGRQDLASRGELIARDDVYRPGGSAAETLEAEIITALKTNGPRDSIGPTPGHGPLCPPSEPGQPGHTPKGVARGPSGHWAPDVIL